MMMIYRYCLWLLLIFLFLTLGTVCYLQSGKTVVALQWLELNLPSLYNGLFNVTEKLPMIYREGWVEYHFSDIMWAGACAMLVCGFWVNQFTILKLLLLGMGCAIFYEMLQLLGMTQGTFDWWDLFYSLCSGVFAAFLTYLLLITKDENNENALNEPYD